MPLTWSVKYYRLEREPHNAAGIQPIPSWIDELETFEANILAARSHGDTAQDSVRALDCEVGRLVDR